MQKIDENLQNNTDKYVTIYQKCEKNCKKSTKIR